MVPTKQVLFQRMIREAETPMTVVPTAAPPVVVDVGVESVKEDAATSIASCGPSPSLKVPVDKGGLRAADVLMGRGTGPSQSHGNIRFRALVTETHASYLREEGGRSDLRSPSYPPVTASCGMDAAAKKKVAYRVLCKIRAEKGRFLQRLTRQDADHICSGSLDEVPAIVIDCASNDRQHEDLYMEISDRKAIDKIKLTLRFLLEQKARNKRRPSLVVEAAQKNLDSPLQLASSLTTMHYNGSGSSTTLNCQHSHAGDVCQAQTTYPAKPRIPVCGNWSGSLPVSESGTRAPPRLTQENMSALVAEERAVNLLLAARLFCLKEAERENRRQQLLLNELAKAEAERTAAISNRVRAWIELCNSHGMF
jgi:hypothetical protein